MSLFNFGRKTPPAAGTLASQPLHLLFASTAALERALDGTDDTYLRYYFAIYHCSPDESAGINRYREQLRQSNPASAAPVGRHFVLWGPEAFKALTFYYELLAAAETLPDDFREHAKQRLSEIAHKHQISQRLEVPIDLSEGQLCDDPALTFYACLALDNRQIVKGTK